MMPRIRSDSHKPVNVAHPPALPSALDLLECSCTSEFAPNLLYFRFFNQSLVVGLSSEHNEAYWTDFFNIFETA